MQQFKPEFLNRIDEHIIFNSLSKDNLRGIVSIETKKLQKRLEDRQISVTMKEAALDYLADVGFDPVYGARPLKRAIQRELETIVAKSILRGEVTDGDSIIIDVGNDELIVRKAMDVDSTPVDMSSMSGAFD